jgi:hypothetical protein
MESWVMETWMFVWVLAAVLGMAVAGITGSGWALITGERPHPELFYKLDGGTPFKVVALVVYGPMAFITGGYEFIEDSPVFGMALMAVGVVWSFLQGVFILTTFFGFT